MLHHHILYEDAVLLLFLTGICLYTFVVTFMTLLQMNCVWKISIFLFHWNHLDANIVLNGVLDAISVSYFYSLWYGIMTFLYLFFRWVTSGIDGNIVYIFMPNLNYFILYKKGSEYTFSFSNPVIQWKDSNVNMDPSRDT